MPQDLPEQLFEVVPPRCANRLATRTASKCASHGSPFASTWSFSRRATRWPSEAVDRYPDHLTGRQPVLSKSATPRGRGLASEPLGETMSERWRWQRREGVQRRAYPGRAAQWPVSRSPERRRVSVGRAHCWCGRVGLGSTNRAGRAVMSRANGEVGLEAGQATQRTGGLTCGARLVVRGVSPFGARGRALGGRRRGRSSGAIPSRTACQLPSGVRRVR